MPAVGGFDHALIGVADLEAAAVAYRRLGFTTCPRGRHIGWGTANTCIMFEGEYIELLGIVDGSQFTNNLDAFLAEHGEGLLGMAFASADAGAAYRQLIALGPEAPKDLRRLLELPEGTATPRFRLVHLPAQTTPGLKAFFCEHLTPGLLRRPEWLVHANGAQAIASATLRLDDVSAGIEAYGRIFGDAHIDGDTVHLPGGGRLVVEAAAGRAPGLAAIAVAVADMDAAARQLAGNGILFSDMKGALAIASKDACGVDLTLLAP